MTKMSEMSNKPTLVLDSFTENNKNHRKIFKILGISELTDYLTKSNKFNIEYHNDHINLPKGDRGSTIYYKNGEISKKIYLDVWEYNLPTYSKKIFDGGFDLIIKLQHRSMSFEQFEIICHGKTQFMVNRSIEDRKAFFNKIVPWTFFPSAQMLSENMAAEKVPIKRLGFFSGVNWRSRWGWKKFLEKQNVEVTEDRIELAEYIDKMRTSRIGIVLKGRGSHFTEAKNRREFEYMILGKPAFINYKPFYYNPLIEGKHYIYFDEKSNLQELADKSDLEQIAKNGHQWYLDNGSPEGTVNVFMQILNDRFHK